MRHGRSVKALVLSLGLVVTSAGLAAAQGPGGPPMGGQWGGMGGYTDGWRLPPMLRGARRTPDQQARVREILAAHRPTLRSLTDQLRQAQDEVADRLFAAGAVQGADLQPALQRIEGVGNVSMWGIQSRQVQVELLDDRLRSHLVPPG